MKFVYLKETESTLSDGVYLNISHVVSIRQEVYKDTITGLPFCRIEIQTEKKTISFRYSVEEGNEQMAKLKLAMGFTVKE